jgi:hypothetical protein
MAIIKWLKRENKMLNLNLRSMFEEVQLFQAIFNIITFLHVYKENNQEVDYLFKAGMLLDVSTWIVGISKRPKITSMLTTPMFENSAGFYNLFFSR